MRINIILPSFPRFPAGGYKIMYEYANRFVEYNDDIMVYHVMSIPYMTPKRPNVYLYLKSIFLKHAIPNWFEFDKRIKIKSIYKINDRSVRDADISFYTQCSTSFPICKLSAQKGVKVNLIQGYETWILEKEILHKTYQLPVVNIAISDFIANKVKEVTGKMPHIVYNAVDGNIFKIKIPIAERSPHTVSMLYSTLPAKGFQYGLEALKICKEQVPDLTVELFGISSNPNLQIEWINYHQTPYNLSDIYNSTAIFLTPSIQEGWGLTATEAIFCGCALVSTNAEGLTVFAHHQETALTTEPANAEALAKELLLLLQNSDFRITLAQKGNEYIQRYNWNQSIKKIRDLFHSLLNP